MKAKITRDGCLVVISENDTEDFALLQWQKLFEDDRATIYVDANSKGIKGEGMTPPPTSETCRGR